MTGSRPAAANLPRIIVPIDRMLAPCLDPVAAKLAAAGYRVVRPATDAPLGWPELAAADVAVLTPRTKFAGPEIAAAHRLKGIVFPTIGVEALDLAAADAAGLAVGNGATTEAIESMAEANVMLMAALLLDLPGKSRALRERGWRDGAVGARMMRGRTIGFIGFGRIARATLRRLANWGVNAVYFDPHVGEGAAPESATTRIADLPTLLRTSDIVNVLVELTAQTHGMIGTAELAMMRRDACLVNTARGAVVDEAALAHALRDGVIAGAALDAFATEPLAADSPLRTPDNVILTPHNIGHTRELMDSFVPATYENVVRIAAGEPPLYFKNPQVLPKWRERLARLGSDGSG
jgi:D-3-phosphoglycerate dehydrogenase / 2-oxoglutarate reductase